MTDAATERARLPALPPEVLARVAASCGRLSTGSWRAACKWLHAAATPPTRIQVMPVHMPVVDLARMQQEVEQVADQLPFSWRLAGAWPQATTAFVFIPAGSALNRHEPFNQHRPVFILLDSVCGLLSHWPQLQRVSSPLYSPITHTLVARCTRLHTLALSDRVFDIHGGQGRGEPWPGLAEHFLRCLRLLAYCPSLRCLKLQLRSLTLSHSSARLLGNLTQLHDLHVEHMDLVGSQSIEAGIRTLTGLTRLVLRDIPMVESENAYVFGPWPRLQHFEMARSPYSWRSPRMYLHSCPELTHLHVDGDRWGVTWSSDCQQDCLHNLLQLWLPTSGLYSRDMLHIAGACPLLRQLHAQSIELQLHAQSIELQLPDATAAGTFGQPQELHVENLTCSMQLADIMPALTSLHMEHGKDGIHKDDKHDCNFMSQHTALCHLSTCDVMLRDAPEGSPARPCPGLPQSLTSLAIDYDQYPKVVGYAATTCPRPQWGVGGVGPGKRRHRRLDCGSVGTSASGGGGAPGNGRHRWLLHHAQLPRHRAELAGLFPYKV